MEQDIKIGGSATTTTKYWNKLYETKGATTTLYIFLPNGELLGTIEGNGSATSTFITHTDHLGGTNVVSDKNGSSTQLTNYYPYGSVRQNEKAGSFDEKRKAVGQYYDDATSLSYLNARYYDGNVGRFESQDPVFNREPSKQGLFDPQSLNSYSYALNNPLTYSDANGEAVPIIAAMILLAQLYSAVKDLQTAVNTLQSQQSFGQKTGTILFLGLQQINPVKKASTVGNSVMEVGRATVSATKEAIQNGRKIQMELGFPNVKVGSAGGEGAGKSFTQKVKDMFKGKCVFCGNTTEQVPGPLQKNVDHSIPRSRGGDNSPENAQATCRTCNLEKGTQTSEEFTSEIKDKIFNQ